MQLFEDDLVCEISNECALGIISKVGWNHEDEDSDEEEDDEEVSATHQCIA